MPVTKTIINAALELLHRTPEWTWDPKTDLWRSWIRLLREFIRKHGHARIPTNYRSPDGMVLSQWVNAVKRAAASGQLSVARKRELLSIKGFDLVPTQHRPWSSAAHLARLRAYVAQHRQLPLTSFVEPDGMRLGRWIVQVRSRASRGKLPEKLKRELDGVDYWTWKKHTSAVERAKALALKAARDPLGWQQKSRLTRAEYAFIGNVRARFKNGTLPIEVKKIIRGLPGWVGEPTRVRWLARYEQAAERFKQAGGFPPKRRDALSAWISRQARLARLNKLSKEQLTYLAKLPGWTSCKRKPSTKHFDVAWGACVEALREFTRTHGHSNVPARHVTSSRIRLGSWCDRARRAAHYGKLSDERRAELRQFDGFLDGYRTRPRLSRQCAARRKRALSKQHARAQARRRALDIMVANIATKARRYPGAWYNTRVLSHKEYVYIAQQRSAKRAGRMRPAREARLAVIPDWYSDDPTALFAAQWLRSYKRVQQLNIGADMARLPSSRDKRVAWLEHQRGLLRKNRLSAERVALLEKLPVWKAYISRRSPHHRRHTPLLRIKAQ